jgi:hypothetical protein
VTAPKTYPIDPADPRAPTLAEWEAMTPAERQRVVDQLPSEIELGPPEGDPHRLPKQRGLEALDAFFRRMGRRVYLSSELPVYYPGERMFAPDLIAAVDVEPHERMRWVVAQEGRGLDLALEVTLEGSRNKDLVENVARFALLGIPEYSCSIGARGGCTAGASSPGGASISLSCRRKDVGPRGSWGSSSRSRGIGSAFTWAPPSCRKQPSSSITPTS